MKKHRNIVFLTLLIANLVAVTTGQLHPRRALGETTGDFGMVYLNLTKIGLLDGQAGIDIPEKHLEYGKLLSYQIGAPLPGPERVTATNSSIFIGWVIQSPLGGLQKIDLMPSVSDIILQAYFDANPGSTNPTDPSTSEAVTSEPISNTNLYLRPTSGEYLPQYKLTKGFSTVLNTDEYSILGLSVTANFEFFLGTPDNLSGLGATTLPTYLSNKPDGIGYTLSNSATNKTTDYLSVTNPQVSGTSDANGSTYNKFNSPTALGSLQFKTSGTYDIYIVFWNNFGWAQIYVSPSV